jgi:hypothetical protein
MAAKVTASAPARSGGLEALQPQARDVTARKQTEAALQKAVAQIRTLHGLLPICMHCKKIRDDRGHWSPVEVYVHDRADVEFSHGLCPHCLATFYPDVTQGDDEGGKP